MHTGNGEKVSSNLHSSDAQAAAVSDTISQAAPSQTQPKSSLDTEPPVPADTASSNPLSKGDEPRGTKGTPYPMLHNAGAAQCTLGTIVTIAEAKQKLITVAMGGGTEQTTVFWSIRQESDRFHAARLLGEAAETAPAQTVRFPMQGNHFELYTADDWFIVRTVDYCDSPSYLWCQYAAAFDRETFKQKPVVHVNTGNNIEGDTLLHGNTLYEMARTEYMMVGILRFDAETDRFGYLDEPYDSEQSHLPGKSIDYHPPLAFSKDGLIAFGESNAGRDCLIHFDETGRRIPTWMTRPLGDFRTMETHDGVLYAVDRNYWENDAPTRLATWSPEKRRFGDIRPARKLDALPPVFRDRLRGALKKQNRQLRFSRRRFDGKTPIGEDVSIPVNGYLYNYDTYWDGRDFWVSWVELSGSGKAASHTLKVAPIRCGEPPPGNDPDRQ